MELARALLEEGKLNLVIVRSGQVLFTSKERGVTPFFQAIQDMGSDLHNAAAADRIVGSAIAMLCLHAGITSVYADIASQGALDMLKEQEVDVGSRNVVPYIFDYDGTDLCPFEKLAHSCSAPSELFAALQSLFADGGQ